MPESDASQHPDPLDLFHKWVRGEEMVLATATPDRRPSARSVLLKRADERGFTFHTIRVHLVPELGHRGEQVVVVEQLEDQEAPVRARIEHQLRDAVVLDGVDAESEVADHGLELGD